MAGPGSAQPDEADFGSAEERLAFAEIALAGAPVNTARPDDPAASQALPDDPLAAFPD
jgi:hypothetical protein